MKKTQVLTSERQPAGVIAPTVSVIIPVHNGGAKFRICLNSILNCQPPPKEIIVVVDGDTGNDKLVAEEFTAHVLSLPQSKGPSAARNLGVLSAHGDILYFVDADVAVPPDAIGQISQAFTHDAELAAAFGSYDEFPFEKNFLSQYKNLLHHYVHQTAKETASTFWTGSGAIRREVFDKVGGFDEEFTCIEDIELGYRLKAAGYNIKLLKDLKVKHLKHWGILSLLKTDFFCRALPWTELILNDGSFPDDLNVKFSGRISVILVAALPLLFFFALWFHWLAYPICFLIATLIALNWDVYRFFYTKRGVFFAIKTISWHWFYYFYSGLAFGIGLVTYHLKRKGVRPLAEH